MDPSASTTLERAAEAAFGLAEKVAPALGSYGPWVLGAAGLALLAVRFGPGLARALRSVKVEPPPVSNQVSDGGSIEDEELRRRAPAQLVTDPNDAATRSSGG